ncbi:hypothetical protein CAF53_09055 [Sphingobium sp. LB126]|uniref:alpha/beta hydrolase domain-containing protein n=1 Tax=Sphingobium sp. LB126 TaxID=1983755 RepID=UPI000C20681F|nr:alpha/beta hydrolase domain-containing protein [Sphingobium sp. LB126]PJG48373.1 hypothetical protein CAF53_09055 [Sphingobium sp. LB126]
MTVEKLEFATEPFRDGHVFGDTGAFERIFGEALFAVDPKAANLAEITDLGLVPPDADGKVRFSANFEVVRPADPAKRNGRAWLDLPNRGGARVLRNTNREVPSGVALGQDATLDGWILQQGYALIACGWQHDVPQRPGLFGASLPEALEDGERITGLVISHLQAFRPAAVLPLGHMGHKPYEVVPGAPATLYRIDHMGAPKVKIPPEQWHFANAAGEAVERGADHVALAGGFPPGPQYELAYRGVGAVPTALGLVGVRDFLSFLRFAGSTDNNPCAGDFAQVYAFGGSQPAGVLRLMAELDLFRDDAGRPVLEGYIAHGGSTWKSDANWRFGQPSAVGLTTPAFVPPFDTRAVPGRYLPKAIYTQGGPDYWDGAAALCHVDVEGKRDLPEVEQVRHFYLAGMPHVRGAIGDLLGPGFLVNKENDLDFGPFLRAAVVNLDRWVREGEPFPASRVPRLSDGTLVPRDRVLEKVAAATGAPMPPDLSTIAPLDFGPRMGQRIVDREPVVGTPYPSLVSDVDADGNDIAGVLHPEMSVPLGTYLPWNLRGDTSGAAGRSAFLMASILPFAVTEPKPGDRRRPVEARYASRAAYLDAVRKAAAALVRDRLLLPDDEDLVVDAAAERWDAFCAAALEPAAIA